MSKSLRKQQQSGFTIVELMIALSVFTLVLILITTGVLRFTRQYYKGIIASKTQETARAIVDDITRNIQYNGGDLSKLTATGVPVDASHPIAGYCLGQSKRYSFYPNSQVEAAQVNLLHQHFHALVTDQWSGCTAGTAALGVQNTNPFPGALNSPRELLGQHMRLSKFVIDSTGDLYTVSVRVVYGDDDLLCSPTLPAAGAGGCHSIVSPIGAVLDTKQDVKCKPDIGSAFCAVSELSTTVNKRVK